MARSVPLLLIVLAVCACGNKGSGGASAASKQTKAGVKTGVRLLGTPGSPGGVGIRVENGGSTAIRLQRALRLEHEQKGAWSPAEVSDIWLRSDCQPRDGVLFWAGGAKECVEIAAGATFDSAPWMGTIGDAQCACEECGAAPMGRYRFVAEDCDGGSLEGEPFAFGSAP